jgi:hypothetical protein
MNAANPAAGSLWIVGPRYDLAFFSTLWLPPLLILAAMGFAGLEMGAAFFGLWIYHLFIRLPHFGAMFRVTYLRSNQLPHYRRHWFRYFAMPLLILLLYAAPLATPMGYESSFGFVITTVAYLWGYQHIGMQNYGILQIYRIRNGSRASARGVRLERGIFYAIIASVCVANHFSSVVAFIGGVAPDPATTRLVNGGLLALAAILIAVYGYELSRTQGLLKPAGLYFVISVVAMVQWPFYSDLPAGSWFMVFNGHHSVAYLGLLFLMTWNEKHPDQPLTLGVGAVEYLKYFVPLVGFSLLLILAAAAYQDVASAVSYGLAQRVGLKILLGFFVAHYYVESLVWHFRDRHNRETTLPLLRAPGPQA